ncbi:DUF6279 family lipoprotein [Roseateles sp. DC23W]|uniref:DUF6279 family lipoprotein n=1 Tax=Pelomonas dachongensis TaxID=3299029 RepID=A0ABW7EHQ1_9BURK
MRTLKSFAALLCLLVIAGCSSLTLAYQQLPLAASLWAGSYFDLDSTQRQRLKDQLQIWQAWHRREELPQLQALLVQARQSLEGGVTRDELLALERGARASAERSLQHAAPLAAPLLAGLRPEQWAHLQKKMDEKTEEWREKNAGADGAGERGKRFSNNLERWLGDLDRSTRREARAEAAQWRFDLTTMAQGRAARQARTLDALRAWSRQDLAGGTALLMRNLQPQPAEQAYREEVITSLLKVLNGLSAEQREEVLKHWQELSAQLSSLGAR